MPVFASGALSGNESFSDFRSADQFSDAFAEALRRLPAVEPFPGPLLLAIETEIIPRLMLAHGGAREHPGGAPGIPRFEQRPPPANQVDALTQLVLKRDASHALAFVEGLYAEGLTQETLYLELLAPTARHLGELWDADLCDFIEVTVALGRLHHVLRQMSPAFHQREEFCVPDRRIILAALPGEQHSFGLSMVEEFFRHAGWDVWGGAVATSRDLSPIVHAEWFDAAGFSVGCDCRLDALAACICAVRLASLNQKIGILVGGPLFIGHPELAAQVGADIATSDAGKAVCEAENLVAARRQK